jgi:hypothetical protein
MEPVVIGVFAFILFAIVILVARDYYVNRKLKKLIIEKYSIVKPLIKKIQSLEKVTQEEILEMIKDPSLRYAVFKILEAHNKKDLFPDEYYTLEKGAESFLVNWLEFPTEIGFAPDQIQFETIIELAEPEALGYYVFKFKVDRPQWPTKDWMIGVCGPYQEKSLPYDIPDRIFSRFNVIGSISFQSEVLWVHENVSRNLKQKMKT